VIRPYSLIILSTPPIRRSVELSAIPHGRELRGLACRVMGREVLASVVLVPEEGH